jgi:hypothetical protein
VLTALLVATLAAEPALPKGFAPPAGWTVAAHAEGDLNGDGRPDLAVVLRDSASADDAANPPPRLELRVYLQRSDGSYALHTTAPRAVCAGCGGPKGGDLLGEPAITKKGLLELSYSGGSREAWDITAKWRLDKSGHFRLIGWTQRNRDTLSEDGRMEAGEVVSQDVNFATQKQIEQLQGKGQRSCAVPAKLCALELSSFVFEDFHLDDCSPR